MERRKNIKDKKRQMSERSDSSSSEYDKESSKKYQDYRNQEQKVSSSSQSVDSRKHRKIARSWSRSPVRESDNEHMENEEKKPTISKDADSSYDESFEKKFNIKEYHNRPDKEKVICSIPLNKLHLDQIVKTNNHIKKADYVREKSKRKRTSQSSSDSCDSTKTKSAVAKILELNYADESEKNFDLHINKDSSENSYSCSSDSESSSEKNVKKNDKKLKSIHKKEKVNQFYDKKNTPSFKRQETRFQANENAYYSDSASSCSSNATVKLPSTKSDVENFDELSMSIQTELKVNSNSAEPSIEDELITQKTVSLLDDENSMATKFDSRSAFDMHENKSDQVLILEETFSNKTLKEKISPNSEERNANENSKEIKIEDDTHNNITREENKKKVQHFLKEVATTKADEAIRSRGREKQRKSTRCSSSSSSSSESRSESSYSSTSSSSGSSISSESSSKSASAAKSSRSRSSSSSYVEKRSKYSDKAQKHRYSRSPFKEPRKETQVGRKIHIGRLTKNTNKMHLIEIFGLFGNIKNIDLPLDRYHSNVNRGFCYVEYERSSDAEKAIFHMNSGQIDGNRITVSPVIPFNHRCPPLRRQTPSSIRRGRYMPWRKSPQYWKYPRGDSRRRIRSPFRRRSPPRRSPVRSVPRRDRFSRRSTSSSC